MTYALSGYQDPYFSSTEGVTQNWSQDCLSPQTESDYDSGCSMGGFSEQELSDVLADFDCSPDIDIYPSSNTSSVMTSSFDNASTLSFSDIEISDDEEELEVSGVDIINQISEPDPNFQVLEGSYDFIYRDHLPEPQEPEKCAVRKRQRNKQPILSQFIYNSLENPSDYSTMLVWVDKSKGIFKFFSETKESFAAEWGRLKNNRTVMTYQKMARALRIYIKKEIVITKMKKKLHYIFRGDFMLEKSAAVPSINR